MVLTYTMKILASASLLLVARLSSSYILKLALLSPLSMHCMSSTSVFSTLDGSSPQDDPVDAAYPGTAVNRMLNIRARARSLTAEQLSADWQEVRRLILWAGGAEGPPARVSGAGLHRPLLQRLQPLRPHRHAHVGDAQQQRG